MKETILWIVALSMFLVLGCAAAPPNYIRTYDGAALPKEQASFLWLNKMGPFHTDLSLTVNLYSIDGVEDYGCFSGEAGFELSPGYHTLVINAGMFSGSLNLNDIEWDDIRGPLDLPGNYIAAHTEIITVNWFFHPGRTYTIKVHGGGVLSLHVVGVKQVKFELVDITK